MYMCLLNLLSVFFYNRWHLMQSWFSQRLSTSRLFFLVVSFYSQLELLLNNVYNLQILCDFFMLFVFLFSLLLSVFLVSMHQTVVSFPPNSSFIYPITFVFLPLSNGLKFDMYMFSHILHDFCKNCIIHQLWKK